MKGITQYIPATLWKRLLAYIVDTLVIGIFVEVSFIGLSKKAFGSLSEKTFLSATIPEITLPIVIMTLVIAVLSLLYWSVLEYKLGQSLGKMLFKLYVDSETGKLTFAQTLVRNIPKTSSLLLIIDSLALLGAPYYKRFTERWSQTYVVDKTTKT